MAEAAPTAAVVAVAALEKTVTFGVASFLRETGQPVASSFILLVFHFSVPVFCVG